MSKQAAASALRRKHDPALKRQVVVRMEAGENVSALARETGVRRKVLYEWRDAVRQRGVVAFPGQGHGRRRRTLATADPAPPNALAAAHERIAALPSLISAPPSANSSASAPSAPRKV